MDERVPPQDIGAERTVLGGMLMSRTSVDDVEEALTGPADFYHPAHELIYDAIVALTRAGTPADAVTVGDELTKRGVLDRTGGQAYLHELIMGTPTASNAGYYAQIVAKYAVLRRLAAAGERVAAMGRGDVDLDSDLDDLLNAARAEVDGVTAPVVDVDDTGSVYDAIAALEEPPGMPTPWTSLTEAIAGWHKGAVYVVGARPGVGKTVIGTNVAVDVARRGRRAVMFSLEMPKTELYLRMLSQVGSVSQSHLNRADESGRRAWITDDDHRRLAEAAAHIAGLPLTVDDRARLSVAQIRSRVRNLTRRGEVGVVVVDYVGMVRVGKDSHRAPRYQQIDLICDELKAMAKDFKVPVVLLAQLNRGIEGRGDKAPTLADLRESGGLEQYADVALLLHRDVLGDDPSELTCVIAKNRHGSPGVLKLDFLGHYSRVEDRRGLRAAS